MSSHTIKDTKTNLSKLIKCVDYGQKVTFGSRGESIYEIRRVKKANSKRPASKIFDIIAT